MYCEINVLSRRVLKNSNKLIKGIEMYYYLSTADPTIKPVLPL